MSKKPTDGNAENHDKFNDLMSSAHVVDEMTWRIRPVLAGQHPASQGAALAELLALWLAGHPPAVRERLLAAHVATVRALVTVHAAHLGTGA